VERKAVFDLWQSLLSGRLYQQAQLLCQHYRCPTLLIEFERGRPFSLAAYPGLPSDADSSRSLSSSGGGSLGCSPLIHRLVLLILHFPSLRLIWAPHSAFAANLFIALKAGREQPDPSRIEAIDQEFFLEEEVVSCHKKNSTRSSARSSTPSSSTSLQLTLAASMKKKSSSQTSQPELDCKASSTEGNRREEEDAPSEKRFRDSDRKVSDTALDVIAVEDDAEDDKKNGAKEAEGEKNRMEKTGSKILSSSSLASSQQVSGKTSSGRTSILALGDVAPLPSSKSGVCTPGGGGRTSRQRQLVLTTEGADVKASKVATSGNKSVGGWIGSSGVKIGENRERLEKTEEKERERKEEGRHVSLRPASSATNSTAVDFLRRLPGVNSKNIYLIVSKVPSIADLVAKSEKELTDLLGRDDGHHLYSFLNAPINFD
ncbi:ercc4 domain-containing protein, partial [Cystoisospora suis]